MSKKYTFFDKRDHSFMSRTAKTAGLKFKMRLFPDKATD